MDVKTLDNIPSWEWPEEAGTIILETLGDVHTEGSDRLLAVELAGDTVVINDELADALLAIVRSGDETEELRGKAAISLGPALEDADMMGFDDPDDELISEEKFDEVQQALHQVYLNDAVPKDVRRRILEASVRAPEEWHQEAVRSAYSDDDDDWRLTAVFCMRFIRGFEDQILESLESEDPNVHYHAVCAAGNWEIRAAWSNVEALITSDDTDKYLMLAAIEAISGIRPDEAQEILGDLTTSDDEDIAGAAFEALAMAEGLSELDDLEDFEDDDDDEYLN